MSFPVIQLLSGASGGLFSVIATLIGGFDGQGPVVQSVVSLTSSLVAKMLTVLVSKISNSRVVLLKKM